MDILYAQQGDTLDRLLYRQYGRTAGLVEIALEHNPQLANQPVLAIGQEIKMPDIASTTTLAADTVNLWD